VNPMTNPPSKDNAPTILKETRQQKGISLEMVHEATKIPLDALKAIEQGYSVHRLPAFYQRGFIRIYAKYLELDETAVLHAYSIQEVTVAPKPQPIQQPREIRPKSKMPPQPIESQNRFIKDTLKPLLKRNLTGARLGQIGKFIVLIVGLFLAFKMVGCVLHKAKSSPKHPVTQKTEKKSAPAVTVKPTTKEKARPKKDERKEEKKEDTLPPLKVESSDVVEKMAAAPAMSEATQVKVEPKPVKNESKPETAKSDKKSKRIELTVRATKNGWLQVKTDGQIVFQSTLKKGAAETWSASDAIELSGKNINLLEFELNGKMLGALGPNDRGAKRVVFTKDGLSVKK